MIKLYLKGGACAFQYFAVRGAHGDLNMVLTAKAAYIYE